MGDIAVIPEPDTANDSWMFEPPMRSWSASRTDLPPKRLDPRKKWLFRSSCPQGRYGRHVNPLQSGKLACAESSIPACSLRSIVVAASGGSVGGDHVI